MTPNEERHMRIEVDELLRRLDSGSEDLQLEALESLAERLLVANSSAVQSLLSSTDSGVRMAAVFAVATLVSRNRDAYGDVLLRLLGDEAPEVRTEALVAIVRLDLRSAAPSVRKLLRDSDEVVRAGAAEALAWIGDASALPDLEKALSDSVESVRTYAASAYGLLGMGQHAHVVEKALLSESAPSVRATLIAARSRLRQECDLIELFDILDSADDELLTVQVLNTLEELVRLRRPRAVFRDETRMRESLHRAKARHPVAGEVALILEGLTVSRETEPPTEPRRKASEDS